MEQKWVELNSTLNRNGWSWTRRGTEIGGAEMDKARLEDQKWAELEWERTRNWRVR